MVSIVSILVDINTIYITAVVGVLIGYPLVQLGQGWGKILGDYEFKSPPVLFVGLIVSLIIMGVIFKFAYPIIALLLLRFFNWKLLIDSFTTLFLYIWFSSSCGFKIRWEIVGIFLLGIFINLGYLYLIGALMI